MTANPKHTMDRRSFLEASSAGLGLVVGFHLPSRTRLGGRLRPEGPVELNAWIRVDPDDTITFFVPESEMGQGVLTAIPQILADEMDADWTRVRSVHALADAARYGRQSTGGSTSIRTQFAPMRRAGAAARELLAQAAARRWGVDRSECRTTRSTVVRTATGERLRYGELAADAALLSPPEDPPLKDRSAFSLIGQPVKRLDAADKVTGKAVFGSDVRVPGMLVAQVVRPPTFGATRKSVDAAAALATPGVRHVVEISSGVAVVADHFWAAKKGREALRVEWDSGEWGSLSTARITEMMREAAANGATAREEGDSDAAIRGAGKVIDAVYELPYLAHATMEPMNCTADVRRDACEVWAPTQSPSGTQSTAARITGLPAERVTVHTTHMGGGFGRRSQTDFVADGVETSKAVGKPVQVIWTREDDTRGGYYRPPAWNRLVGAVDAGGNVSAWTHQIGSPSIARQFGPLRNGIDDAGVEGAANLPYAIPNVRVTYGPVELPISLWFWRSVGSSLNAWVTECFIDELAEAAGADPVEFRLRLLAAHPRHQRVLRAAADRANWTTAPAPGRGRGAAVHEAFGSIVAQVAEVSIDPDGEVRVHHVACAVDCGDVINPGIIRAQMESGIAYGLSAALWGELTIADGAVVQGNFDRYPVLRIDRMPAIDVDIVTSGDPLGGIGEPGTPPIAPAVCNALAQLTGRRIRKLPIGKVRTT